MYNTDKNVNNSEVKMNQQERDEQGKFLNKSDEFRHVRSIRVTDKAWEKLGEIANNRSITRADLIEEWLENDEIFKIDKVQVEAVMEEILQDQKVTRKGKDRSAVRRGFEALLERLQLK